MCVSVCNNVFSHKRRIDLFAVNPASAYHISGSINRVCVCFMLDIRALVIESVWRKVVGNSASDLKHANILV